MKRILIVAGEASADRYGARLARKLRTLHPGDSLQFFGTGGDAMEREGIQLLCHIRLLASIGPREALAHFRVYYETFQKILRSCLDDPPAVAVLLDFPEFNLRLAKKMKRAGVRVISYISPQPWAWRSGRIPIIRGYADHPLAGCSRKCPPSSSFLRRPPSAQRRSAGWPLRSWLGIRMRSISKLFRKSLATSWPTRISVS